MTRHSGTLSDLLPLLRAVREETHQTSPDHRARVARLARNAEALGVTGHSVSRVLGERLKDEGRSIFERSGVDR